MQTLQLRHAPVATAGMLIRRPVSEVFRAFVDPAVTTRFWFSGSTGRLELGKEVRWEWDRYGVSAQVRVRKLEPNRRILIEWQGPDEPEPTRVEWEFRPMDEGATYVSITNSGFSGDGDAVVRQAIDSAGGFALVLAGLKALLEHDVVLNLVWDRAPGGLKEA